MWKRSLKKGAFRLAVEENDLLDAKAIPILTATSLTIYMSAFESRSAYLDQG